MIKATRLKDFTIRGTSNEYLECRVKDEGDRKSSLWCQRWVDTGSGEHDAPRAEGDPFKAHEVEYFVKDEPVTVIGREYGVDTRFNGGYISGDMFSIHPTWRSNAECKVMPGFSDAPDLKCTLVHVEK